MPVFVEIAVNVPHVSKTFHYHLPEGLETRISTGHLVTVPFGRQTVQGVVLDVVVAPTVPRTKPVLDLLDPEPVLTPLQIKLAKALAERSLTPLGACINLMLPPGLGQTADTLVRPAITKDQLARGMQEGRIQLTDAQRRVLKLLLEKGPLRGRQIARALPRRNWQASVQALKRKGMVVTEAVLQAPTVRPKVVRTAQLACSPEEAEDRMETLGRRGSAALARRQAVLRFLMREPGPVDVTWVYAESGGNLSDLRRLAQMGLVLLGESEVVRDPLGEMEFVLDTPPELTREQEEIWARIRQGIEDSLAGETVLPFLLFGVTGSGKTEIYLRALELILERGKQAIILVPEIALTPQTVRRFVSRFPHQIGLVHSRLSPGERYDTWRRARAGLLSAVVGPRSALFTPFANPALFIVDECHDSSYYQSDTAPSFHARDLAVAYARLAGGVCLMGSATPEVVSTYRAARGEYIALSLPERILAHKKAVQQQMKRIQALQATEEARERGHFRPLEKDAETTDLPPVQVVDMREELKSSNRSIFSRALQEALASVLEHRHQAILFLNRRGMATYVFCRDCGYALKCPRCDIPLTCHLSTGERGEAQRPHVLMCHRCGYQRHMPSTCPQCSSKRIKQYGTGTERVEKEVQTLFPQARTLRWDWETTRQKGAHDAILSHFASHQADILVGTQMLAKGLDLPLVTLVGVVLADVGLNLPDFRAAERTFQVLTQVAGRAGRSPLGGRVILQTFQPENYVIQSAARHDYRGFYSREISLRRKLGYPPFSRMVRLEFRGEAEPQVESAAQTMARKIRGWISEGGHRSTELIGPVPCFFARLGGIYRWQIVLRGPDPVTILRDKNLGSIRVEVDPVSLL